MHSAKAILLWLPLTGCAATGLHAPLIQPENAGVAAAQVRSNSDGSRLGPPSPRGISLRHVDRANGAEPPIALY